MGVAVLFSCACVAVASAEVVCKYACCLTLPAIANALHRDGTLNPLDFKGAVFT